MATSTPWRLVHRLHSQAVSLQPRIRSACVLSLPITSARSAVQRNVCMHHMSTLTPTRPLARYGSVLQRPWNRTNFASLDLTRIAGSGKKRQLISLQSLAFSTGPSSKDPSSSDQTQEVSTGPGVPQKKALLHENIYTLPNFLTFTRLVSAPVIGYWVLQGEYTSASILFGVACVTDALDGWIARRFHMQSIVGTILDPMADKTLMTILTVTLTMQHLIPIPIATVILGRDAGLILASFYYRYISLPEPKTFKRYWDFSIPSAEVKPTMISKVNTAVQMAYICLSLLAPVFDLTGHVGLDYLGYTCAATTIWSGASYVYTKDAVRMLHPPKKL